MKSPFSARRRQNLFAIKRAPGLLERLPSAAAPIAVTLVGGLGIIVMFAALLGQEPAGQNGTAPTSASEALASPDRDTAAPAVEKKAVAAEMPAATRASELIAVDGADTPKIERQAMAEGQPVTAAAIDTGGASADASAMPQGDDASSPLVAVAETSDEILKLEAIQRREVLADIGAPSNEKTAGIPPASPPKVAAIATKWVNMRAGPSDDAEVLMVVPALAEITAESGCNWCAVTYNGHQGFIYKNFISYQ